MPSLFALRSSYLAFQSLAYLSQVVLVLVLLRLPQRQYHDLVFPHEEPAVLSEVHPNLLQQLAPQVHERENVHGRVLVHAFPHFGNDTLL